MEIFKKQHDALTDKEKNNFKEAVLTAAENLPVVGAGVELITALREWEKCKKERIIPKMMKLAEPSELSEEDKDFIEYALGKVLSDPDIVISQYLITKKEELSALIVKNYEDCLTEDKDSEKVKIFAENLVSKMQDNIDAIETIEQTDKTLLKTV